jgi:hypothetical protein
LDAARPSGSVVGLDAGVITPLQRLDVQRTFHTFAAGFDARIAKVDNALVMRVHGISFLQDTTKMSRNPKLWIKEMPGHFIIRLLSLCYYRKIEKVTEL